MNDYVQDVIKYTFFRQYSSLFWTDGQTDGQTYIGKNSFNKISTECYKSLDTTHEHWRRHYEARILKKSD